MCANTGVNLVSIAKQPTLDILMYSLFHFNIKTPNFTNYTTLKNDALEYVFV